MRIHQLQSISLICLISLISFLMHQDVHASSPQTWMRFVDADGQEVGIIELPYRKVLYLSIVDECLTPEFFF